MCDTVTSLRRSQLRPYAKKAFTLRVVQRRQFLSRARSPRKRRHSLRQPHLFGSGTSFIHASCVAHGAELPRALNQRSKDSVGEKAKDIGDQTRVVGQTVTQRMRKRQHPLLHRNSREDAIHQMSCRIGHLLPAAPYGFRWRASPSMSKEGLNRNFLHRGSNNYFTMIRSSRTGDKTRRALM